MIAGLVLGMRYVHVRDIIHRDLKPANIVLDERYRIRICDFGNSKVEDFGATTTNVAATLAYAAPEMILHAQNGTKKADIFAFGLILYEMLTGKRVFDAGLKIFALHNEGYRPEIPRDVPIRVAQLIKECWSADPSERPTFHDIYVRLDAMGFALFDDMDGDAVRIIRKFVEEVETLEAESLPIPGGS
jgi:serine/threonine protein kinase